jgi:hypothetical protein
MLLNFQELFERKVEKSTIRLTNLTSVSAVEEFATTKHRILLPELNKR